MLVSTQAMTSQNEECQCCEHCHSPQSSEQESMLDNSNHPKKPAENVRQDDLPGKPFSILGMDCGDLIFQQQKLFDMR